MKEIKNILLVLDDAEDSGVEENLVRNGFDILKTSSVNEAISTINKILPDLVVVPASDVAIGEELLKKQKGSNYLKRVVKPGLVKLKDYLDIQTPEHIIIRGLSRSKRYRENEIVFLRF